MHSADEKTTKKIGLQLVDVVKKYGRQRIFVIHATSDLVKEDLQEPKAYKWKVASETTIPDWIEEKNTVFEIR